MKTLSLTGIIGSDVRPQNIIDFLSDANGDGITVNVASVGGYIYDGFHIFNLLKDYKGKKNLVMTGTAMSIAAYIAMAFDNVQVYENSIFMIHNALVCACGDYRAMAKEARELQRLNDVIALAYAQKSGKPTKEILDLMDAETYLYGKEIIEAGFADSLIVQPASGSETEDKSIAVAKAKKNIIDFSQNMRPEDFEKVAMLIPQEIPGVAGKENNTRGNSMPTKAEVFQTLKVLKTNAEVTLPEVAEALGLKHLIVTDSQVAAEKAVNTLREKLGGDDIVGLVDAMLKVNKEGRETVRNARLDSLFGVYDDKAEKKNELRFYMGKETAGCFGDALEEKIETVKKNDAIAIRLMAERADATSDYNQIGAVDHKGATNTAQKSRHVTEL